MLENCVDVNVLIMKFQENITAALPISCKYDK